MITIATRVLALLAFVGMVVVGPMGGSAQASEPTDCEGRIAFLTQQNIQLTAENKGLKGRVAFLTEKNTKKDQTIERLRARIRKLSS